MVLRIDIETRSSADISKTGLYRYAQDKDFRVLLFAYQMDDGDLEIVDLAQGETIPRPILDALVDPGVTKRAFNAAFEWYCLNSAGIRTPLSQWECTMVHSLYCGYPGNLEASGKAIGLPEEKQKMTVGKALIRYFCVPCKPTKANGGRTWNLPKHDPENWALFKAYCKQDVATEAEIDRRLAPYPVPGPEWEQWRMDVEMNATGVRVDTDLVNGALAVDAASTEALMTEAARLTGLENPNSVTQLKQWFFGHYRIEVSSLDKASLEVVEDRIAAAHAEDGSITRAEADTALRVLDIRKQLGKTSVKKYVAMATAKCEDNRIRGLTQFYGANRTGRWAGRLVQLQNLPRNYMDTLDAARTLVSRGNVSGLQILYKNVPDVLSQLVRTAFIPSDGGKLVVADFSAIEARVIAWLAGEQWVNEVFATHGKIYEATAAQMFHVPIERIQKGNPEYSLRQKGKVATLALGYQGGVNALKAMGALNMGLSEEELPDIVSRWRQANARIVDLWHKVGQAAITAVRTGQTQGARGLMFALEGDILYGQRFLTVRLPSGRKLYYPKPFLAENQYGQEAIHYHAVNQQTRMWEVNSTYGGKLTENIVQAIARDCLAETLKRLHDRGLVVVFHVHDEVIIDADNDLSVDEVCGIMAEPIEWAPGLILKGAGFEGKYYKKD